MIKKTSVFLSGAEKNSPTGFSSWRSKAQMYNINDEVVIINPTDFFDYLHKKPMTDRQCRDYVMYLIDRCDVVLVNLDYSDSSIGTGMELQHAYDSDIPIIGFGIEKNTWYSWSQDLCEVTFKTYQEALEYINEYYAFI